jgi:hypothetical protein
MKLEFSRRIFEKSSNIKFHFLKKNRPVGAELLHADGQTDRQRYERADIMKLTVAFRSFAKARDKHNFSYISTCQTRPFPY